MIFFRLKTELYLSKEVELKAKNKWFVVFAATLDCVYVCFYLFGSTVAVFTFLTWMDKNYLAYSIALYKFSK